MSFASHILVPTDFSHASELAAQAAALLAKQFQAKVTLVHVHDPDALRPPVTIGWSGAQQSALVSQVEDAVEKSFAELVGKHFDGVEHVSRAILHDASAAHGICRYAEKVGADLIVISTHGRTGLAHLLIGSVAERVVRHASCPVLTLRSHRAD
jgi:universal stress protein A